MSEFAWDNADVSASDDLTPDASTPDAVGLDSIDSGWGEESVDDLTAAAQSEAMSTAEAEALRDVDLAYFEQDSSEGEADRLDARAGGDVEQRAAGDGDWGDTDTGIETPTDLSAPAEDSAEATDAPVIDDSWGEEDAVASDAIDPTDSAQIDSWLGEVNPNYNGEFDDPYSNNCGKCSESVFNMFEGGTGVTSADTGTYDTPQMQEATGVEQVSMSPSEIEAALSAGGPGSHALIGVDWEGGGGHWYNAYYDGQQVWAVDGQTGTRTPWPGVDVGSVKNWDAGIKIK